MSPLRIGIAAGPIEQVAADVAVVAFFSDERPLRGDAGHADWRLCGTLSRLIQRGKLSGAWGEAALVPSSGGVRARWVLVLGLGSRAEFDPSRRRESTRLSVVRALDLCADVLALPLPPAAAFDTPEGRVDSSLLLSNLEERFDLLLEALAEASAGASARVRIRLVPPPEEHPALAESLAARARRPAPAGLVFEVPEPLPRSPARRPAGAASRPATGPGPAGARVK